MSTAPDLEAATTDTLKLCTRIATYSDTPGTTRLFLSPATRGVHQLLTRQMQALGMSVRTDAAGNLRGTFAAQQPASATLLIGSHLDTVPDAGAYDGILGIALPLALLSALHTARVSLPFSVELIAFSEEEGVRFKIPFIGSRAVAGSLKPETLLQCDSAGISVAQALTDFGLDPKQLNNAAPTRGTVAFLEVHIEQGPVLDTLRQPLGVVSEIVGQCRYQFTFFGQANHAGTTPMPLRKDALAAAAEFINFVEHYALSHHPLVATVGSLAVAPGATNVIPGMATLSVDVRHPLDHERLAAIEVCAVQAQTIATCRGLKLGVHKRSEQASVPMHPRLQQLLAASITATGHTPHLLPSGAGHDAMILAESGIPTAMLFLRSPGGLSHHPDESVLPEDVHAALQTLAHFLQHFPHETIQP